MIASAVSAYYLLVIPSSASKYRVLFFGLGWLSLASPALGESAAKLVYTAPEGCASQAEFVAAVAARGARFDSDAGAAQGPRTLHVTIRAESAGYSGSFRVEEAHTASSARELHGDTCSEVVDALAVVSAIALREAPTPAPASTVAPVAAPTNPPPAGAPAKTPEPERRPLRAVGQFGAERVTVSAGDLTFDRDIPVTLSAGATIGVLPSTLLPRFDLTLARANFVTAPDAQSYLVGSIMRVRWTVVGPGTYRKDGFETDMLALKTGVSACSSLVYDPDGLVALFCAEVAAGGVFLETRDETGAVTQAKTVGLGSAALEADLRYNLGPSFHLGFHLGGEVWLGEGIGAEKPDGSQLFQASLFNGYAQLGLGLNF